MLSNFQGTSPVLRRVLVSVVGQRRLRREEEDALARRAASGDQAAAGHLVAGNLQNLAAVARGYRNLGLPLEDLIHEGAVGLLQAIRHYDPERNVRFFTYASFFVRRTIVGALAHSCKTVRVPRHVAARARRSRAEGDARTSASDVGQGTGRVPDARPPSFLIPYETSLDQAPRPGAPRPSETLSNPEATSPRDSLLADETRRELSAAVARLPSRDRDVVAWRFGLDGRSPRTLRQVGSQLRLSKERIRQLESRALAALRQDLEERWRPIGVRLPPTAVS